ncbi:hypothetical protein TI05_16315, partial [Achromatium sp. WMS3]
MVGHLSAVDPNAYDTVSFSVDDSRFEVVTSDDGIKLKLKNGIALDYEANETHQVNVTVTGTDNAGLSIDQIFTLNVTNEVDDNVAPTAITLDNDNIEVTENNKGAVVGHLTVTDPNDPDGIASYTYSVDDPRFTVDDTQLKLKSDHALNYEATETVNVTVTATDQWGLSKDQLFTINVLNEDEGDVNVAPNAITLDTNVITENVPGFVVGTLTVYDINDPERDDPYTIYSVNDSRFEVNGAELKLKSDHALDYEATENHTVEVTVTAIDEGGLSKEQTFTINVLDDQNVAPTEITLDNNDVTENNRSGAVVGNLTVTDPNDLEGNDTYLYTVDDPRIEVNYGQLQLKYG